MKMSRRSALRGAASTAAAASLGERLQAADSAGGLKGRVNHSVCKWCYNSIPLEDLCKPARQMGLESIELLGPGDWPTLKKHGLTCAMTSSPVVDGLGGITKSFNRVEHHDKLVEAYSGRMIPIPREPANAASW